MSHYKTALPAAWRYSPQSAVRLVAIGHSTISVIEAERAPALIARIVFDIDICEGLPERVPATGSRRKSRDHLRSRSGCIPQPCGIGSSSTRLRLGFLRRTRVHHHKLGWTRFRTTFPLQARRYQISVLQGFSSRRSLLVFHCLLKSTPQQKNKSPPF
jgi:hypothetical protein